MLVAAANKAILGLFQRWTGVWTAVSLKVTPWPALSMTLSPAYLPVPEARTRPWATKIWVTPDWNCSIQSVPRNRRHHGRGLDLESRVALGLGDRRPDKTADQGERRGNNAGIGFALKVIELDCTVGAERQFRPVIQRKPDPRLRSGADGVALMDLRIERERGRGAVAGVDRGASVECRDRPYGWAGGKAVSAPRREHCGKRHSYRLLNQARPHSSLPFEPKAGKIDLAASK